MCSAFRFQGCANLRLGFDNKAWFESLKNCGVVRVASYQATSSHCHCYWATRSLTMNLQAYIVTLKSFPVSVASIAAMTVLSFA